MGGGGKKGGGQQAPVADYYMSTHFGLCYGPIDALTGIYVKEKEAWVGYATAETAININQRELFGGNKKEGGVAGFAHYLPGGNAQILPEGLAARLGRTSATAPGFRGLASIFFVGNGTAGAGASSGGGKKSSGGRYAGGIGQGFYWGSNNPYMHTIWTRVFRQPRGLDQTIAIIANPHNLSEASEGPAGYNPVFETALHSHLGVELGTVSTATSNATPPDVNPSHMIYECLTNDDWGMGAPSTIIDVPSFANAAITLFNENFGLSMIWTQQTTIEAFVGEILDHVQGTIFVNPRTGLLTLKLIRDDYNADDLRIITPDDATLTSFQRKAWAETINEIIVTWTNPENEQEETVTFQDLANIAMQGGVVSDGRNYYGVRNATKATELAVRDLRTAAAPLCSADLRINRKGWNLLPGETFKLTWPERGITELTMRITRVDYGKPGDPYVKFSAIEDIFTLPVSAFEVPLGTEWLNPDERARNFTYVDFFTIPYPVLQVAEINYIENPEVLVGVFAAQVGSDTYAFELSGEVTLPTGGQEFGPIGSRRPTGRASLLTALTLETQSVILDFPNLISGEGAMVSGFGVIGRGDLNSELVMFESFTEGVGWTLARGVFDTVPRAWPAQTPIWFLNPSFAGADTIPRVADAAYAYKLQPRTSLGLLPIEEANQFTFTPNLRPWRPFRPANVRVQDSQFGPVTVNVSDFTHLNITWSNRNRTTEDSQVRRWTEGTVPPEDGQTTTIEVLNLDRQVIQTYAGLTGTSYAALLSDFSLEETAFIRVLSVRDGIRSLNSFEIGVTILASEGWGANYGNAWGQ
jgi:hypothetical protein